MNMIVPIFSNNGKIDPSQFISVINKVEKDNTNRVLAFTAKGLVYEFKVNNGYEVWHCIGSPLFT
jgi:hypothetical protein